MLPLARARLLESSSFQLWLPDVAWQSGAHRRSVPGTAPCSPEEHRDLPPAQGPGTGALTCCCARMQGPVGREQLCDGQAPWVSMKGRGPAALGRKGPFRSPGSHPQRTSPPHTGPPALSPALLPWVSTQSALAEG